MAGGELGNMGEELGPIKVKAHKGVIRGAHFLVGTGNMRIKKKTSVIKKSFVYI